MLLVRSRCVSWGLEASSPEQNPNRRQAEIHLASTLPSLVWCTSLLAAAAAQSSHEHTVARPHPGGQAHRNAAAAQRLAVLSNLPPDEQPTELLANTMRILDRVSDLETHVKFLTHHIQQLLAAGGAVTPGQTPASTPHATPAFGLSPARESASPPPQQQFNPFQPLVPYATAAQMAAPPPPPQS